MNDASERLVYIKVVDTYYPIGCLIDNSFNESSDTMDTTFRGSNNGWSSMVPTVQTGAISFSGIVTDDDRGGTIINFAAIKALKRARTEIEWRIGSVSGGDAEDGTGYITSISEAAAIGEFVTFSGEITLSGEPTTTDWTPPSYPDIESMIPPYEAAQG